jgi:hypothetical protein
LVSTIGGAATIAPHTNPTDARRSSCSYRPDQRANSRGACQGADRPGHKSLGVVHTARASGSSLGPCRSRAGGLLRTSGTALWPALDRRKTIRSAVAVAGMATSCAVGDDFWSITQLCAEPEVTRPKCHSRYRPFYPPGLPRSYVVTLAVSSHRLHI